MRHFETINVFGKSIWRDISSLPREVYISEDIPEAQRERLYRLLETLEEEKISVAVDHMLRKLSQ